jgi:hypothetical protein
MMGWVKLPQSNQRIGKIGKNFKSGFSEQWSGVKGNGIGRF